MKELQFVAVPLLLAFLIGMLFPQLMAVMGFVGGLFLAVVLVLLIIREIEGMS